MTKATRPIGRLIQNTTGQVPCSTRIAPRAGPMIAETPKTPEMRPWMRARSAGV